MCVGRAVVLLAELAGVEAGTDVLELAKHLGDAVGVMAEAADDEIGEVSAAGLSRAGHLVLRAAGVGGVGLGAGQEGEELRIPLGAQKGFIEKVFSVRPV